VETIWEGLGIIHGETWEGLGIVHGTTWEGLGVIHGETWEGLGIVQCRPTWSNMGGDEYYTRSDMVFEP